MEAERARENLGSFDGNFSNLETQVITCYDWEMNVKLHERFQRKLQEALEASQLSQGQLASRLGVSRQMISQYATGQTVPGLDVVERFSEALGLPDAATLIDESEIPSSICLTVK